MAKLFKFLSFFFTTALFIVLIRAALVPTIPSEKNLVVFYSNQKRDDLRLVLKRIFLKAKSTIFIMMYGFNDEELLKTVHQKTKEKVFTTIYHDRSNPIKSDLAKPIKAKGLMHRKIVVIDNTISIIGSANMTTSSLVIHDNLSVGFYHPPLAQFLQNPTSTQFSFTIDNQEATLWLLPEPSALPFLEKQLTEAKSSIFIAMFTLTHPSLVQTIIKAHQKGTSITVAIDHYAAKGASKKAVELLQSKGVNVIFSQGLHLLHHKWAYIDQKSLVLGSANWTKAAFTKNQDTLLFLNHLNAKHRKTLNKLCRTIKLESKQSL
jgi:cardiolipin synthase A/B